MGVVAVVDPASGGVPCVSTLGFRGATPGVGVGQLAHPLGVLSAVSAHAPQLRDVRVLCRADAGPDRRCLRRDV
jgi:hypothetical protein